MIYIHVSHNRLMIVSFYLFLMSDFVTDDSVCESKIYLTISKMNADDYIIFPPRLNTRQYYAINSLSYILP